MLNNYFKIAWRNIKRDYQFTLLNLIGLSTGLVCVLLIYLWVQDELNVDHYNQKDQQLFQVMVNQHNDDGIKTGDFTPGLLSNALEKEIPALEKEKKLLEVKMNNGAMNFEKLQEAAERVNEIIVLLDKKEMRWLELSERK